MDGFHLGAEEIAALGLTDRKGAPDTFDAPGFVALLRALRPAGAPGWAPAFDRSRERTVPGAIEVPAATSLIIVEGNYLLLPTSPWDEVAGLLDECWYLAADPTRLRRRLIARSRAAGRDAAAARRWVETNDLVNAGLVEASAIRADRVWHAGAGIG
jgi:pantothenate kinase